MNWSLSQTNKPRFQKRIIQTESCWLWNGALNGYGYGLFWIKGEGRYITAHRAAWLLYRGDITNNLHVLHRCDIPRCVNPDHLFLGTQQDNMFDAKIKRRHAQGEQHYRAKLTEKDVREIRRAFASGQRYYQLAKQYGVDRMTIKSVVIGASWKGVK